MGSSLNTTMIFSKPRRRARAFPLTSVSFFSWNCRGIGKKESCGVLKSLIKKHNPNIVFLMETKGDYWKINQVRKAIGFTHSKVVEAKGNAGGIALLWTNEVRLKCSYNNDRLFCCDVEDELGNGIWSFIACHGTPYPVEKFRF